MKALIIHAHPEKQSFNSAMAQTAQQELEQKGYDVVVSDLYAMSFNPVASEDDFKTRKNSDYLVYALEQRFNFKNDGLDNQIKTELDKLMAADLVIFNFPLFWFSVPAILKGWIDRVLVSGVCYGGMRFYNQGGLSGKKAMVALTLGGREHMFGENAIHGELINGMLRPLLQGTLAYTGMDVLPPFIGYHIPYITQEAREGIMQNYRQYLQNIEQLIPLEFPKIEDFDERLYPKV